MRPIDSLLSTVFTEHENRAFGASRPERPGIDFTVETNLPSPLYSGVRGDLSAPQPLSPPTQYNHPEYEGRGE